MPLKHIIQNIYKFIVEIISTIKQLIIRLDRKLKARERLKNKQKYKQTLKFVQHNQPHPINAHKLERYCSNAKYSVLRNNIYTLVTIVMVALSLSVYKVFVIPSIVKKQTKELIAKCNRAYIIEAKQYNIKATIDTYDDVFVNGNYELSGIIDDDNGYIQNKTIFLDMADAMFKKTLDKKGNMQVSKDTLPHKLLIQYEIVTISPNAGFITTSFINPNAKGTKQSMWVKVYLDNLRAKGLNKQIQCIGKYIKLYSLQD